MLAAGSLGLVLSVSNAGRTAAYCLARASPSPLSRRASDAIDYSVGLSSVRALGEAVGPERPLAMVHAASQDAHQRACDELRRAITISDAPVDAGPMVIRSIPAEAAP